MRKSILSLPLLLVLGACSSTPPRENYMARADAMPETTPVAGADASLMLVQMPAPGGLVTNVHEQTYPNGITQRAVLEGGAGFGENNLEISVLTAPPGGSGMLAIARPSQDSIRREIIARYPKLEMRIVTQPRQNGLGVFGLAIGRSSGGARCVFAWQWVDDLRRPGQPSGGGLFSFGSRVAGSGDAMPASIRVHLCRKDATVDDLAATVEGMTLASPAIVERALDPARRSAPTVSARSGRESVAAASAIPDGSLGSALGPQKNVAVAEAPRQRKASRVARRKAPVEETNEAVIERTPLTAAAQAYSNGPRYLAPVAGAPAAAPVTYGNPASIASAAPTTAGLDPSLPAAAYRGPSYHGN